MLTVTFVKFSRCEIWLSLAFPFPLLLLILLLISKGGYLVTIPDAAGTNIDAFLHHAGRNQSIEMAVSKTRRLINLLLWRHSVFIIVSAVSYDVVGYRHKTFSISFVTSEAAVDHLGNGLRMKCFVLLPNCRLA